MRKAACGARAAGDAQAVADSLAAVGLPADFPDSDAKWVALKQEVDFFEQMAWRSGDDLFGLTAGFRFETRGVNLNSYIAFAASTLRQALQAAVRFAPLERASADFRLELQADGTACLALDSSDAHERLHRQSTEFHLATVLKFLRAATGADIPLRSVSFAHHRRAHAGAVAARFGCPVDFSAASTQLRFAQAALDLPIPSQDDTLCDLLIAHGEMLLSARLGAGGPDILRDIERRVLDNLPRGGVALAQLAQDMGLSRRTLARRMRDCGVTLRGLTDNLRRELAASYLRDPALSPSQIAYLLGFSEPSAFYGAFRRWNGCTPGDFRAKARVA